MTADFITALLVNAAVFSALLGIMLLVRKLLGKRLSAVLRYALWAVVIVKLLIPFGFESRISPIEWLPSTPVQTTMDAVTVPPAADYEAEPVKYDFVAADAATEYTNGSDTNSSSYSPQGHPAASAADPQAAPAAPLDWTDWAFIVWAAGCLAVSGWLLLCRFQIWRCTSRRSVQPNAHLLDVFEQCKRGLGIRHDIRLRMQSVVGVPAITGMIRPVLLVPSALKNADDETLRHVFLHELTHYKRGDLAVLALLNLLSCVYWFNPLVWLGFQLVRRDMEAVCDQYVLQRMEGTARSGYIRTVLQFAGTPANHRLSAALSLNDGRVHMEKRIRNMFRTRRTGIRAKITAICVAILLLAACVLTACQPAILDHVTIENVAQSTYAADVSQEIKSQANVTVRIDADVEGLDITALPVYAVEQGKLTQENLDSLGNYFLPGHSYYILSSPDMYGQTKTEVEALIAQTGEALDDAYTMSDAEFDLAYYPASRSMVYYNLQTAITSLQTQLETAPDEITYERLTGGLHLFYESSTVYTDMKNGDTASIGGNVYAIAYCADALNRMDTYSPADAEQPSGVEMTRQEAITLTQDTLDALGITGMALTDVSVENVYRMSHVTQYVEPSRSPADAQCWGLTFNRSVAGIPVTDTSPTTLKNISCAPTKDINPSYFAEQIFVAVDDTGVLNFWWNNATTLTGTVTESAALLPFEDILDTALDSMYYGVEPIAGFPTTVNIHTIRLGYIMVTGSYDSSYQLTPVWDFIGDAVRSDGSFTYTLDDNRVFLTVDALDGSVIDLTYE